MKKFPIIIQSDSMDCGPTCLRMIAKYYGKDYSLGYLRELSYLVKEGVSLGNISDAAQQIGFKTVGGRIDIEGLIEKVPLPCILHWNQEHFVVLYRIKKKVLTFYIADPGIGLIQYSESEFIKHWISTKTNREDKGIILILEPVEQFYKQEGDKPTKARGKLKFLSS